MNLLDENIRHDQSGQLLRWRIPFRLLTRDLARPGIQDADIIPLLHHGKNRILFTHDQDYFKRSLIWLDLYDGDAAIFIRRFLRHPDFASHAKRMGKVVRLHLLGITFWQRGNPSLRTVKWKTVA